MTASSLRLMIRVDSPNRPVKRGKSMSEDVLISNGVQLLARRPPLLSTTSPKKPESRKPNRAKSLPLKNPPLFPFPPSLSMSNDVMMMSMYGT